MSDSTTTFDQPRAKPARAPKPLESAPVVGGVVGVRQPCVGLPVQYHTDNEVLPGLLQRQSKADPALWDVRLFLGGPSLPVLRVGVKHSDEPKAGCWTFLPGG